jgi:hypothetical protein
MRWTLLILWCGVSGATVGLLSSPLPFPILLVNVAAISLFNGLVAFNINDWLHGEDL